MQIDIVADNREIHSGIPESLAKQNANVKMVQLYAGDYMINDEIVIERKTNEDFVQSIIDGRLMKQCAVMRKTTKIPLIIVEKNPFETRHKISRESIKGALLAVSLSWQIPVIRSSGKEDTVRLMLMAAGQQINPPSFIHRKGGKPKNMQNHQHFFIQGLPGVGSSLAHRLLARFGSIDKIVRANVKSLMKVEGIGAGKAEMIFLFLREV